MSYPALSASQSASQSASLSASLSVKQSVRQSASLSASLGDCAHSGRQPVISFLVLRSSLLNHVGGQRWRLTVFIPAALR